MAKLRGNSSVAGPLSVAGPIIAQAYATPDGQTAVYATAATLVSNADIIPKFEADGSATVVKSAISDNGSTVAVDGRDLSVTGNLYSASVYIEEDANSVNYLRLYSNSGLTASRTLTINVNNTDRTLAISGNATLVAGTMVPTTRTVAGKALSANVTLDTLTLSTSGTGISGSQTYDGSAASTFTVTSNATSANTASAVVARDGSGNFSAGTITAALAGNASTASALATARTITLSGAVTGSTTFDGSGNATIATTATSDPTLTLSGDATGSATFTNLGNATLTVAVGNASTATIAYAIPTSAPSSPVNGNIWLE